MPVFSNPYAGGGSSAIPRASFVEPRYRGLTQWSIFMDQRDLAMQDTGMMNPFGIPMDGPLQRTMAAFKHEPKIDDTGDIGRIGSRGGGDWG